MSKCQILSTLLYILHPSLSSPVDVASTQSSLEQPIPPLPPTQSNSTLPTTPAAEVALSAPIYENTNTTLSILNGVNATANPISAKCDEMFGTNLNLNACYDAIIGINPKTKYLSFGRKASGSTYQLPHRMSSSKSPFHHIVEALIYPITHSISLIYSQVTEPASSISSSKQAPCPIPPAEMPCSTPRQLS